ncbi:unnamed protein product [Schistosoma mattheei]|uniref:HhH-GPD domain-containing protein n=1 Tax=Schistosoma mattheei TaxID=31246 RepID=A0A183PY93_9TREM|nr:unnamed protein product [Schistosoma mattheei]
MTKRIRPQGQVGVGDIEDGVSEHMKRKWEPPNWRAQLSNIRKMRESRDAPVDSMGCERLADETEHPKIAGTDKSYVVKPDERSNYGSCNGASEVERVHAYNVDKHEDRRLAGIDIPSVGPKMAYLAMQCAWKKVTGIGVDTHVHRIINRLKWNKKPTKSPEETRLALEEWFPR